MSLSAMVIGLGTLAVFIFQTNLIGKQQYMSVYPHLSIQYSYTLNEFGYYLQNKGIGPAIIKSVEIVTDSGEEFNDIDKYFEYLFSKNNLKFKYSYSNIMAGAMISKKEKIELLKIRNPKSELISSLSIAKSS